jgi:hypothetical protein
MVNQPFWPTTRWIATWLAAMIGLTVTGFSQGPAARPAPTTATSPAEKRKIVPKSEIWFGKLGEKGLEFEVKNGVITGSAVVPYVFECSGDDAVEKTVKLPEGGILVMPGGPNGGRISSGGTDYSVNFSKLLRYTGPNSFEAMFEIESGGFKYTVTFKGSFGAPDSASGSESVSSVVCKKPTVLSWTASPAKPANP